MGMVPFTFIAGDFLPHGFCYGWDKDIIWLHVVSDIGISTAYFTIPFLLAYFTAKRTDLAFRWVYILFGLFILCCGLTHLLEVWSVWNGTYLLTGSVKGVTALVSLATAASLVPLIPKALSLPSPTQLREANAKLAEETETRLRAEAELAEQKRKALFQELVEAAPNGMILIDENEQIVLLNSSACKIFGLSDDELILRPLSRFVDPGPLVTFSADKGKGTVYAMRTRRGQSSLDLEVQTSQFTWNDLPYTLVSLIDVTERLQTKKLLEETTARLERVVTGTTDGVWEWHLQNKKVWWSPRMFDLLGYDVETFEPNIESWISALHPDEKEWVLEIMENHLEEGTAFDFEHRILTARGGYRWFHAKANCVRDKKGEPLTLSGSLSDIQNRKVTEKKLEEQRTFLNQVFESVQNAIFVVGVDEQQRFRFEEYNPTVAKVVGLDISKARGRSPDDLVPTYLDPKTAHHINESYRRCLLEKKRISYVEPFPVEDPKTWWLTNLNPQFDHNGNIFRLVGSSSDITQIKKMEAEIKQSETFLRSVLDSTIIGVYVYDYQKQTNTYINETYQQLTGYSLEDLQAFNNDFLSLFHADDVSRVLAHIDRVLQLKPDENEEIEYRFKHKDGHYLWLLSNDCVFEFDEQGNPKQMLGTFIDITKLKVTMEKLQESNHALEHFAFVASHDLREPLRKVKSFGGLLSDRYKAALDDRGLDYLARMTAAAERMDALILALLKYSRLTTQKEKTSQVNFDQVLKNIRSDLSPLIKETGGSLITRPLPFVYCDPAAVYQIFLNLISNALKYHRPEVPPEVEIYGEKLDDTSFIVHVVDNGIGFENQQLPHMLQIFKRLHSKSGVAGTGIGLAVVKKIVDRLELKLTAQSTPGEGSVFSIIFPMTMIEENSWQKPSSPS